MKGVSGPTPGAGNVNPEGVGRSTGDGSGTSKSSVGRPSKQPAQAKKGPEFVAGGHESASFTVQSGSTDETPGPTAAVRQRRFEQAHPHRHALMEAGFTPDQIELMIDSLIESGNAEQAFFKLLELCMTMRLGWRASDQQTVTQQDQLREKLVSLFVKGGRDAMYALESAFPRLEQLSAGEVSDLLVELGEFGHSYMQLADVAQHKADALPVLLDVQKSFRKFFTEEELPRRAEQLGALAKSGGIEALETLKRDVSGLESHSVGAFDDAVKRALQGSGVKRGEINRLFPR